ncbi:MAG: ATP-binding protein [Saprospiraceae bacterium]|nr:ATP-binding protein [Saprospiraceae bacterium]
MPLLDRPYEECDLLDILQGQLRWEQNHNRLARYLLFCDTDPLVIKIWSLYKYGRCHPLIEETCQTHRYALHLLCRPDLPWAFDPLRENPDIGERQELYDFYKKELIALDAPFVEIGGDARQRLETSLTAVLIL